MNSSPAAFRTPVALLLTAVLRMAAEHHRGGRHAAATTLYREVLALDRRNHDALFLLGVLSREDGRLDEAHQLLTEAGRWATSRELIDAELRLVADLLRQQKQKLAAEWSTTGYFQSCGLVGTAHA